VPSRREPSQSARSLRTQQRARSWLLATGVPRPKGQYLPAVQTAAIE